MGFFRSETILGSFNFLNKMIFEFDLNLFWIKGVFFIFPFIILEWWMYNGYFMVENKFLKFIIKFLILISVLSFWGNNQSFIYFQF